MTDTANAAVPESGPSPKVKSKRGRRILAFILILLLLLLAVSGFLLYRLITPSGGADSAAQNNGVEWIRSIYGINNTTSGMLERASAAVSAPDGTIWVTDAVHKQLSRFTADGRYTGAITGPKAAPFIQPGRFAIGSDGKFYVTETPKDNVRVINQANQEAGSFIIPKPTSIAVSDDRIVVGAIAGLAILDKTAKPIKIIGSRGKGPDQFDYVHGVAIGEDGTIYAVDSYNNRVSAYDKNGKRLWIIRAGKPQNSAETVDGGPLTVQEPKKVDLKGDQQMSLPLGMTIDGAGRLVIIDMFDGTLTVLNPKNGAFIAKYGTIGPDDGEFFYPVSVGYDKGRDWFTVADALNNRVQVIRLPGSAGSGASQAAVRRALAGPLRACLFPFLLLLLALIVWLVVRALRKRRAKRALEAGSATDSAELTLPSVDEDSVEESASE